MVDGSMAPTKSTMTIYREAWHREIAFRVEARRGLFWHGTSTVFLRKILKEGLIPNPKAKTFDEKPKNPETYSIETFGGAYLAEDWMTAYSFGSTARRKFGGDILMAGATLETRSPHMLPDEDSLRSALQIAINVEEHYSSLTDPNTYWGTKFRDEDLLRWGLWGGIPLELYPKARQLILADSMEEPMRRFIPHVAMKLPSVDRAFFEVNGGPRVEAMELLRAYSLFYLDSLETLVAKQANATATGDARKSFKLFRDKLTDFSRFLRASLKDLLGHSTLRSMETVGYSGSNKIVLLVSIVSHDVYLKTPAKIKVHYSTDSIALQEFFRKYETHIGSNYEVVK